MADAWGVNRVYCHSELYPPPVRFRACALSSLTPPQGRSELQKRARNPKSLPRSFPTIPTYDESLSPRVRNPRACGDALGSRYDDVQDTTHLPFREDVTGQKVAAGRSPGSRISLLTAPSRRHPPVVSAAFVPGHSGGSAPDSHRLPGLSLRKPTCNRSENYTARTISTIQSRRDYTASYLSRVMVSRSIPSMRTRRVSPSRLGEWNSPTS